MLLFMPVFFKCKTLKRVSNVKNSCNNISTNILIVFFNVINIIFGILLFVRRVRFYHIKNVKKISKEDLENFREFWKLTGKLLEKVLYSCIRIFVHFWADSDICFHIFKSQTEKKRNKTFFCFFGTF